MLRVPNIKDEEESWLLSTTEIAGKQVNVIMANFNYPNTDWENGIAQSTKACRFLNLLQDNCMKQMVEAPTKKNALLDLLMSSNSEPITDAHN